MSLPVALLILFLLGIMHDVLWTVYIRAVSGNRRYMASITAGILTAFGYAAWSIMVKTGAEGTVAGIATYSVGGAIGTFLGFRCKRTSPEDSAEPPPGPTGGGCG